jgi:trehalose 6-phosphate synthase
MPMHRDILIGLLGADLLGFQTASAAENFLRLTHDVTDYPPSVFVCPTSVDTAAIVQTLSRARIDSAVASLRRQLGNPRTVILNVSTADQADSIERGVLGLAKLFRTRRLSPVDVAVVQVLLGGDGADPSAMDRIGLRRLEFSGQLTIDLNHAASCWFKYSLRTSRGVL